MRPIPLTIIRHPKERLSKCTLQPLLGRPDCTFFSAKRGFRWDASGFITLSLDAPLLERKDSTPKGLLLLDAAWALLPGLEACIYGNLIKRSLPATFRTAYPRVSKISQDPEPGLASIEALFIAKCILGDKDPSLLIDYYWRDRFLEINADSFKKG